MEAFTTPFPPVRAGARLAGRLGMHRLLEFARIGLVPLRRFAEENFPRGGGGLLLAGNALHADLTPTGRRRAVRLDPVRARPASRLSRARGRRGPPRRCARAPPRGARRRAHARCASRASRCAPVAPSASSLRTGGSRHAPAWSPIGAPAALPGACWEASGCAPPARGPGPVPVRQLHGQGGLGPVGPDPVDVAAGPRGWHRPPGREPRLPDRGDRRTRAAA